MTRPQKRQLYFSVWNLDMRYELENISLNVRMLASVEVMRLQGRGSEERTNYCLGLGSLETVPGGNCSNYLLKECSQEKESGRSRVLQVENLSKNVTSDRAYFQLCLIKRPEAAMYQSWLHPEANRPHFHSPATN